MDATWHATLVEPEGEDSTGLAPIAQSLREPVAGSRLSSVSTCSVKLKFVYWPWDPLQRQEHNEILAGPLIMIGRSSIAAKAVKRFPSPFTFFSPRDTTVERYLSSRFPQISIQCEPCGFTVTALVDPEHPQRKPRHPLKKRSQVHQG
jgi:hypothetical protein